MGFLARKRLRKKKRKRRRNNQNQSLTWLTMLWLTMKAKLKKKMKKKVRKRALNSVLETQSPRNLRNKVEAPIFKPTLILRTNRNQNLTDHDDEPTDEKPINFVIL